MLASGLLGTRMRLMVFLPAVVVSSWYGGMGPGLLGIALSVLIGDLLPVIPVDSASGSLRNPYLRLVWFTVISLVFGSLFAAIRSWRRRADAALRTAAPAKSVTGGDGLGL